MEFNIKRNGFVRPRDVRRDLVQKICDYFVDGIDEYDKDMLIKGFHPHISYAERKPEFDDMKSLAKRKIIYSNSQDSHCYTITQIRTCEMKLVFSLLQDAGYYIYKVCNTFSGYSISSRPYLYDKKAERIEFEYFID